MKIVKANFGSWHIECIPEDGARISVLNYTGHDLLTASPALFKPPEKFYGEFETRPVFGYDDCFPSVDPCIYSEKQIKSRDHGELCWQKWQTQINSNTLISSVDCLKPEVTFKRIMEFVENKLIWRFEVVNRSSEKIVFLHVMHALFPIERITKIKLPDFKKVADEASPAEVDIKSTEELTNNLLSSKSGVYKMLLLKEINDGTVTIGFRNGLNLHINFDIKLFPTLGIWWNNTGYPEESGLQRTECAFEPIPGTCSDLSKSIIDGIYLSTEPGKTLSWEVVWTMNNDKSINS
jgi:hypothetical protein